MNRPDIQKQRGTTMLLTLVFLIGLFGAIGLATDSGHVLVNKTRLQNALDAAALSAAISVNGDPAHNTANATTAGKATFDLFKGTTGNSELSEISADSLTFQYSKYLTPFTPGTAPPSFVKVSTNALPVAPILIQVVGGGTVNVGAQSTAGPVGQNCSLVPFVMCAKMTPLDTNCNDDTTRIDASGNVVAGTDGLNDCYGYNIGQIKSLIQACNGNNSCPGDPLESGNYNLLDLDGMQGGKDIKDALCAQNGDPGFRNTCTVGNTLNTKPGYTWGNVKQGIDCRFESDTQTTPYPNTDNSGNAITYNPLPYTQYYSGGSGNNRRLMATPIADCRGLQTGNSTIPKVGTACVFLTEKAIQKGSDKQIMVEFTGNSCQQNGTWSPTNATLNGPYKIVIYKTAGSQDS